MTLARGDLLAKLDEATGEPVDAQAESYTRWRISELSPLFSLPADAKVEGGGVVPVPHDTYQLLLVKKEA